MCLILKVSLVVMSINTTPKPLPSGYNLVYPFTVVMPLTLAKLTGQIILLQDEMYPSTTVLCVAEIVQVVNFVFVIPLLGNGIKGKETTTVEPLARGQLTHASLYVSGSLREANTQSQWYAIRMVSSDQIQLQYQEANNQHSFAKSRIRRGWSYTSPMIYKLPL